MQQQLTEYIASLNRSIKYGDALVQRALARSRTANPTERRSWELELCRLEWQVKYLREMLEIADEDLARSGGRETGSVEGGER
jgi:hypothetical protein